VNPVENVALCLFLHGRNRDLKRFVAQAANRWFDTAAIDMPSMSKISHTPSCIVLRTRRELVYTASFVNSFVKLLSSGNETVVILMGQPFTSTDGRRCFESEYRWFLQSTGSNGTAVNLQSVGSSKRILRRSASIGLSKKLPVAMLRQRSHN